MNCINEIEEYILNEIELIYGKNIKQYIENLTIEDKHIAMFGAISLKKDGEHKQMIETLRKEESSVILNQIEKIIERFRKYLPVGDVEKKSFGEVFTPFSLVNEMLDTLPIEVWSNPGLKWGDFCNGIGNFMVIVVKRLMIGLAEWEPNENNRYKHIMENMIYVAELQIKNMFLWMVSMDPKSKLKLNLYRGDSLGDGFDKHMKDVWKVEKFDIIVGNPPYNSEQTAEGKRGGGTTLWDKFVIKILNNYLKYKGYLVFIHPTLWRKPQSERSSSKDVNKLMMKKQIHYLECHDSNDGMKIFNAGTRYDFYLLENCTVYTETLINGEDRKDIKIDLRNYDFIPNYNLEFFDKIVAKNNDERCHIIFNRTNYGTDKKWISDKKNDEFKYTLVHSTPKSGTRYMYSSKNDNGHYGIPKIIFGDSGIYNVIIDINGEFGMTQHSMAIKVENLKDVENIKNSLLSKKFNEFLKSVMWSNFQLDWRLFSYLKKDFWKEFI